MKYLIVFILTLSFNTSFGQDSTHLNLPSPKKAALYSAIIPGGGQIYNLFHNPNKKITSFIKVPIIYTSLYFATNSLISKINLDKELKSEYYNRVNHNLTSEKWSAYDNYNLVLLEKNAASARNRMFFITGGIYIIQIIEASIDAHFTQFDLSPNLSLNVTPFYNRFNISGVTFAFNLK